MAGRTPPPHEPPPWIDPAREIWFITICCARRSANQLALPGPGGALPETIRHRWKLGHWHPHIFLLMPDHCHALLSFPPDRALTKTISHWKHWTAAQHHIDWQSGFFDHRLRRDESFSEKAAYIAENPVRAGLIKEAKDWPYVWRAPGIFTGSTR